LNCKKNITETRPGKPAEKKGNVKMRTEKWFYKFCEHRNGKNGEKILPKVIGKKLIVHENVLRGKVSFPIYNFQHFVNYMIVFVYVFLFAFSWFPRKIYEILFHVSLLQKKNIQFLMNCQTGNEHV
jgi:hypothetical protein